MKALFILKGCRKFIPIPLPHHIVYLAVIFQEEPKGSNRAQKDDVTTVMSKPCCQTYSALDLANLPTCWLTLLQHLSPSNTLWALKCHAKNPGKFLSSPLKHSCLFHWVILKCSAVPAPTTCSIFWLPCKNLGFLQGSESQLSWLGRGVQSPAWKNKKISST